MLMHIWLEKHFNTYVYVDNIFQEKARRNTMTTHFSKLSFLKSDIETEFHWPGALNLL